MSFRYLTDEELNAIRARAPRYGGGDYKALLAEVERLGGEVAELRALGVSLHKSGAMGRDAERAAVVAWLRGGARSHRGFGVRLIGDELEKYADHIERGEHRREEE